MSELKEFEGRTAAEAAINACNALEQPVRN